MLLALTLTMMAAVFWIRFRFGPVSLEQILLNLPANSGDGSAVGLLVTEGVLVCLIAPVAFLAICLALNRLLGARGHGQPSRHPLLVSALAFGSASVLLLVAAGVPAYAWTIFGNGSFAAYYVRPALSGGPESPRNLITIYLESGEDSYSNPTVFGTNLLADLDRATTGWASYDGLRQYPGGGWTMAGLVGDECGIPLKSRLLADATNLNSYGEGVTTYLPGATCLGDLLSARGYTSVFLGGSPSGFAGKGTFLSDHGYQQVVGLADWQAAGEDTAEISSWGLSDHRLFTNAEAVVDRLVRDGDPFHLSLLTLDTHEPAAVFPSCSTADDQPMKTAVQCSMQAVAGFLDHLKDAGYLEDTVVVVAGDHLKIGGMGTSFSDELNRTPNRSIIYRVWSPDPVVFARPGSDQLSVLATTLELLGFTLDGGRAGLGVSLVNSHPDTGTLLELTGEQYRATVNSPSSELYQTFWSGHD